jgi:2-oxoglutarate ferredoxin oxidoreductase subunit beta
MRGTEMEVVQLGNGVGPEDCVVWDETLENPATAFLAANLLPPEFPTALGVFRSFEMPSYEQRVVEQIQQETDRLGVGKLDDLLKAGDTWTVAEQVPAN